MSSAECLREFVNERLTAAAEEIFGVFRKTIVHLEEEIDRQRRLLEFAWTPEIKLHRIELPQQLVCKQEEVLCVQERSSSLDPEPPQIKEEQEELCTSQQGEQLGLKQDTDALMLTHTNEESHHSGDQTMYQHQEETPHEPEKQSDVKMPVIASVVSESNKDRQLLSNDSHLAESPDQKGDEHGDSGSTRNTEPRPKRRCQGRKSHTKNDHNTTMSKIQPKNNTGNKSLKCDICGKTFNDQWKLTRHTRTHTGERPYLCKTCGKGFTRTYLLTDHMRIHTGEKPYSYPHSEDQTMYQHQEETPHEPEKQSDVKMPVITSVVSESNKDRQLLSNNSHLAESTDQKEDEHGDSGSTRNTEPRPKRRCQGRKSHTKSERKATTSKIQPKNNTGNKSLKCDICGKTFNDQWKLTRHTRTHTGEKPYLCKTCGKGFTRTYLLTDHMRIHTGEKPYTCETCGRDFRDRGHLKIHKRRVHLGEKPHLCKTCGKGFIVKQELKRHMQIHTGEKPFLCKTCGKRFNRTNSLTVHMRIHTGEKPYTCEPCGKHFQYYNHFMVHQRIAHTGGEKLHLCKTCGKGFIAKAGLTRHMRIHTAEKSHLCKTCGAGFIEKYRLKRHMRIHTGEKPHLCKICGKKFFENQGLKRHMRTHTGEKPYLC